MPLNNLTIFSKDTGATATLKGYEYQKLKTLETWLQNRASNIDEAIYCEHEDDIFQQDINAGTSKFRQVKLYASKPFSFNSEEITKSIANFFMLFSKGVYSFDTVTFAFETNAAIARKYADNDGDLLKDWYANQDNLEGELLQRCTAKVKSIITDYIKEELPAAVKRNKAVAQEATIDFANLPDSTWEAFTKAIRWSFTNEDSDSAIEATLNNIKALIAQLPFPQTEEKLDNIFTSLYYEVSERMFQDEPQNRRLTNERLDSIMLDLGEEADKQYNSTYQAWQGVTEITNFHPAEFFQMLDGARYSRWEQHVSGHGEFWKKLLRLYIDSDQTPDQYKIKALYEFLWLQFRPTRENGAEATLKGFESDIMTYFTMAAAFVDHEAASDHFTLLQIVRTAIIMGRCDIPKDTADNWMLGIVKLIDSKVAEVTNMSERCHWLELQVLFNMSPYDINGALPDPNTVSTAFNAIIAHLPEAPLYNVTRLNDLLNQFVEKSIAIKAPVEIIERLEDMADKLMPFVKDRGGDHLLAKTYVSRGIKYLHTTAPGHIGKALSFFHKAKDLWRKGETVEGHILALINIGELYLRLNMGFAARYYILSAAWLAINTNPEKLAKRIATALGLLVGNDFRQGSWINAFTSFQYYMNIRQQFDPTPVDNDRLLAGTFAEMALIFQCASLLSPELTVLIESEKQDLGDIYTHLIAPFSAPLEAVQDEKAVRSLLQPLLNDAPLNDLGPTRSIWFSAFGSKWQISFDNNWLLNSLVEEFIAMLQILLVELSCSKMDLHLIRTHVTIEILTSQAPQPPEQLPSNTHFKWRVYVQQTDTKDPEAIKMHIAQLLISAQSILREISLLKDDSFAQHVTQLFQSASLTEKTLTINLYQKIYRYLFLQPGFDSVFRNHFNPVIYLFEPKEAAILKWDDSVSPLYSKERSLQMIAQRLENVKEKMTPILTHLAKQEGFQPFIDGLRGKGWLDWQILMALYNNVLSYHANKAIENKQFSSEKETVEAFREAFAEVTKLSQGDLYVDFPMSYFTDPQFNFNLSLNQVYAMVLGTWGLDSRSKFPNFPALREMLEKRFNFNVDDRPDLSPL